MKKNIILFLLILAIISLDLFIGVVSADKIWLKNGNLIDGEIISQSDEEVKIEIKGQGIMTVKPEYIKTVVRVEDIPKFSPEERYEQLYKKINLSDAKSRLKLGQYCLTNGMLNCAAKEFQEAEEIDYVYRPIVKEKLKAIKEAKAENLLVAASGYLLGTQYEETTRCLQRIISEYPKTRVIDKAREKLEWLEEKIKSKSTTEALTAEEVKSEFQKGKVAFPYSESDIKKIQEYLHKLEDGEKRQKYEQRCLEKAREFEGKATSSDYIDERIDSFIMAGRLYRIASDYKKSGRISREINQLIIENLIIPDYIDVSIIQNFLKEAGRLQRWRLVKSYIYKGNNLKELYRKEKNTDRKKHFLKDTVRCYQLAYTYYSNYEKGPTKEWAAVLYYGAKKKLENIE